MDKVILAYSGGLDTTAVIPWLKETYGYEVVCCCIDCGQGEELDGLEERAKLSGASKLYIEDVVDDLCENYIMPCVQAGAVYEHKYLMVTKDKLEDYMGKNGTAMDETNANGVTSKDKLPLGLYLIVETKYSEQESRK